MMEQNPSLRVTFLLPCYPWSPMGGLRVVYEYANRLAQRGHAINLVHPRRLKFLPKEQMSLREYLRKKKEALYEVFSTPRISWHPLDERVNVIYVKDSHPTNLPDADAVFATGWHTVESVLRCPPSKGEKFNLIQGYSELLGPIDLIDATWRAPMRHIVVSRWLQELGRRLSPAGTTYIPNAIDHEKYRILQPVETRPRSVSMLFSSSPIKGSKDGIAALEIAKCSFPDLKVRIFGTSRRQSWVPDWIEFHRNPPQDFIVGEIYNRSSLFVSPSWSEGYALPPAEAAACGCALVVTDSGGVRDFVEHGKTGLISQPKEPAALAANIIRVFQDDSLRIRLACAANSGVKQLRWENSTRLLEQLLLDSLENREQLNPVPMAIL